MKQKQPNYVALAHSQAVAREEIIIEVDNKVTHVRQWLNIW